MVPPHLISGWLVTLASEWEGMSTGSGEAPIAVVIVTSGRCRNGRRTGRAGRRSCATGRCVDDGIVRPGRFCAWGGEKLLSYV